MTEMDQIRIDNLKIFAHHGVYPEETEKGQNFYVSAVLAADTRKAGKTDDLQYSTHYGEVCRFLNSFLTENTFRLIETAAERSAEELLLHFPRIRSLTLELRKPEAPIPLPFESVSVRITRGWKRAYLGCGSNMGEKEKYLERAVAALKADSRCRVKAVSEWMRTTPYGGVEQDDFLNGAIAVDTLYTPEELLSCLQSIELAQGRERLVHWGPRTLDLDILLYEDCVMYTERLMIPHPDMQNRDFVLRPLKQIAPYEMHPLLRRSIAQLCTEVEQGGEKHIL